MQALFCQSAVVSNEQVGCLPADHGAVGDHRSTRSPSDLAHLQAISADQLIEEMAQLGSRLLEAAAAWAAVPIRSCVNVFPNGELRQAASDLPRRRSR